MSFRFQGGEVYLSDKARAQENADGRSRLHTNACTFCGRVRKRLQRTAGAGRNAGGSAAVHGLDSEGRAQFGGLEQY